MVDKYKFEDLNRDVLREIALSFEDDDDLIKLITLSSRFSISLGWSYCSITRRLLFD